MSNLIVEKIKQFLETHNPLTEECHVVYLLVMVRKLLDTQSEYRNEFIRFYCDWALHHQKTQKVNVVNSIVAGIEESILEGHFFPDGQFLPQGNNVIEFIYKEELLKNMNSLFQEFSLPLDLLEKNNWEYFLRILTKAIVDQPIILNGKKIKSLCFRPAIEAASLEIEFNDGKIHRFINVF